jgi:hypothetical protein
MAAPTHLAWLRALQGTRTTLARQPCGALSSLGRHNKCTGGVLRDARHLARLPQPPHLGHGVVTDDVFAEYLLGA